MIKNYSFGSIFVSAFAFFLIIPLIVIVAFFFYGAYNSSKDKIVRNMDTVADSMASAIDSRLETPYRFLMSLATDAESGQFTDAQMHRLIATGIRNIPVFESIYMTDKDNRIPYMNLDQFSSYDPVDFIGIKVSDINSSSLKTEWSRPHTSPITNKNVVRILVRYSEGCIAADISLDFLQNLIHTGDDSKASVYLADSNGDIISSTLKDNTAYNISDHPLMKIRKSGTTVSYGYNVNGSASIGAIHKVVLSDWYLIYEQPITSALNFYSSILLGTFTAMLLLMIFYAATLFFIRSRLIIPMKSITDRSKMVAKGTFLKFRDSDKSTFRELKTLYESFEEMASTIDSREKELKDKEEYFRSIFDSAISTGLIIISLEAEPVIVDANIGTQSIFGYKLPELLGLPVAGLVKGLSDDITLMCSESRVSSSMVTKRLDMVKTNGESFPALCTVSPQFNYSGKIQGFIVAVTDVTEITKVQNELESEKERLDVTLKSIGEGVIASDRYGRITLANSSAERILGHPYLYLLGRNIADTVQVFDYDTGKSITLSLTDFSEKQNMTFRANMVTKDSGVVTVYITSSAIFGSGGKLLGSVYVFRDVTDRIKMEQELINRKKQLEEINKGLEKRVQDETLKRRKNEQMLFEQAKFAAMGQMINAIAHQWRQPLNALALYVQDIEDAYDAGDVNKGYLEGFTINAMRLINHMSSTIDDFRNFFHSGNDKEETDITEIIFESMSLVTTQLRNQLINYKITITCGGKDSVFENTLPENYEPDCTRKVMVMPSELKQVVLNIIQNARYAIIDHRKSTGNNKIGNIYIHVMYDGDRINLDIANDGGEIPEETLGRVFDPYFSTKPEGEGTGIGLYMSKIIIEDHMNGLLTASNKNGHAVFTIVLSPAE